MASLLQKPEPGAVIAVGALNRMVRDMLEHALPLMWVRGEISNFTCAPSGHCYFTLKDGQAQVRCTMFRSRARLLASPPQNGSRVEVRAVATLFEPRGEFQLNVEAIRGAGVGALYEAFERLKLRLAAEGLFDAARKRALPRHPRRIGIVTSPQAAALRDVLSILGARMPAIPIVVYPTPVQGGGAAQSIARALELASRRRECDVLILCRGGGSIEDLAAFNEEVVARALHACAVPVVTGIGHETDFTIVDFVADLRAPTPSAAAQSACPDRRELAGAVATLRNRLQRAFARRYDRLWQLLDFLGRRLADPQARLRREQRLLRQLAGRLCNAGRRALTEERRGLLALGRRLERSRPDARRHTAAIEHLRSRLRRAGRQELLARAAQVDALTARLQAMNPLAVLERGYALATDRAGRVVTDAATLATGDALQIRFARGLADATVSSIAPAQSAAAAEAPATRR